MTTITINSKNHSIEMNKTFAKAASIFGTEEYNQLQVARHDYPNYRVTTIKQKGSAVKTDFAKLSYKFMDDYVRSHGEEKIEAEYRNLRGLNKNWEKDDKGIPADYPVVKDWFLNTFSEFEQFYTERLALLEKIQNDKKTRLGNRKRVA